MLCCLSDYVRFFSGHHRFNTPFVTSLLVKTKKTRPGEGKQGFQLGVFFGVFLNTVHIRTSKSVLSKPPGNTLRLLKDPKVVKF